MVARNRKIVLVQIKGKMEMGEEMGDIKKLNAQGVKI